ncbi:hypothetical protein H0H87_000459 [Tephrocybe sp. NHM501043]|nr:hypothetical protein H0H87_000459 [Tephrocybe sp. NHM501043]
MWEEPLQVYINFSTSSASTPPSISKPHTVAEGLDRIDATTPSTSLHKAVKKIRGAAKAADASTSASGKTLLDAVTRLETIICPLSEELEQEKAEKAAIANQFKALQRKQEELCSKFDDLEDQLRNALEDRRAALASAEAAKGELQFELDEKTKLKKLSDKFHHALKKQKEEVAKLGKDLEASKNERHILRKKLRVLTKLSPKPMVDEQSPDDSLQVLKPEQEELTDLFKGINSRQSSSTKKRRVATRAMDD